MTKQVINIGSTANDGTGETIRSAFDKTNQNFTDLYGQATNAVQQGAVTTSGLTMTGPAILGRSASSSGAIAALDANTTKSLLALDQVNNTSDANKPISTATQSALNLKMDANTTAITVSQITGLQTALNAKQNSADPISSTNISLTASQRLLGRNSASAGLSEELTPTVAKQILGLGNVSNTADADKPVSTAQATALAAKEPTITAGTAGQYWDGTKTWVALNKAAVGLGNVNNTADTDKPISTATQSALDNKMNVGASITVSQVTDLQTDLDAKANTTDVNSSLATKANKTQIVYSIKGYLRNLTPSSVMYSVVDAGFTASVTNSLVKVQVAPNTDTTFSIEQNGSAVGTITVLSGNTTGTIAWTSGTPTFGAGDLIAITPTTGIDGSGSNTIALTFVIRN